MSPLQRRGFGMSLNTTRMGAQPPAEAPAEEKAPPVVPPAPVATPAADFEDERDPLALGGGAEAASKQERHEAEEDRVETSARQEAARENDPTPGDGSGE
jgi:hypothetical protein